MRDFLQAPPVFIEITRVSLKALSEHGGIELPLARTPDGKLADGCRERAVEALRRFAGRKSWQPAVRAFCGISVHGVSTKKFSLPQEAAGELEGVLRLQIENEFPLPPEALAWGWVETFKDSARHEVVVAAVRRETLEYYDSILSAAGLSARFTVAAFARDFICPEAGEFHAVLEFAQNHLEFATFQKGAPASLGILPAGADAADLIFKNISAASYYFSGDAGETNLLLEELSKRASCRRAEIPAGPGSSAATQGLKNGVRAGFPFLWLQIKMEPAVSRFNLPRLDFSNVEARRWLVRGVALLVLLAAFPFAEAVLMKPLLERKLDRLKAENLHFATLADPEMEFLQYLKQSQPPYLDAIYVFSKAAPPGFKLDSLTMNQRGEIQLNASLQSVQQVMDFRSKLIASGFFDGIVVEDQTPVVNQPKVAVRMTARWKPAAARAGLKILAPPLLKARTGDAGKADGKVDATQTPPS